MAVRRARPAPPAGDDVPGQGGGTGTRPAKAAPAKAARTNPWKAMFVVILTIGLLGAAGWVVLGSRLLVVRHVAVTGTQRLKRAEVVGAASVPLGTPLARLDAGAVRSRVAAVPQVESVRIERHWPSTLKIEITERTPRAAVAQGNRYALVDASGLTIATVPKRPAKLPLLEVVGDLPHNPAVAASVSAIRSLPKPLTTVLRQVTATDASHVTLHLRIHRPHRPRPQYVSVLWGDGSRGREKAAVLADLLSHKAKEYDVSSPDVAMTG